MLRNIGSIVVGLVTWIIVVSVLDRVMRATWTDYATALPAFHFTLPMMGARLSEAAIATLAGGYVAGLIARAWWPIWVQAALLLALFVPDHYMLWNKFPIWYHATFLVGTLVPLTLLGWAAARTGSQRLSRIPSAKV
jgi:hypothetical protein